MERIICCENCSTAIIVDLGFNTDYYGPTIKCARCDALLLLSTFTFTPHIVPTKPEPTLYWTGVWTSFPPMQIQPIIINDHFHFTYPNLPGVYSLKAK